MTVKQIVLEVIIQNYPHVKNWQIEQSHPIHKMSGCRRLRELKELGVIYTFDRKTNTYDFSETSLEILRGLAGEDEKGKSQRSYKNQSHPSLANNLPITTGAIDGVKFIGCFEIKEGRLF